MPENRMRYARFRRLVWGGVFLLVAVGRVAAQLPLGPSESFELSASVRLELADAEVRSQIGKIEVDTAQQRWASVLKGLRQLIDRHGDVVIAVEPDLYIPLRSYAQTQIAALPIEVLATYRDAVEATAERWYTDGLAKHDSEPLTRLVDELVCSRWGDDALMALGEMALQRGWYSAARGYWQRLSAAATAGLESAPAHPPAPVDEAAGDPVDVAAGGRSASQDDWWVYYPDTDYRLADIRARLVLVSIRAGDLQRAGRELSRFRTLHPREQGWLAGRQVDYAEALAGLLAEAAQWPREPPADDWPTLAGGPRRTSRHPDLGTLGRCAWKIPLDARTPSVRPGPLAADAGVGRMLDVAGEAAPSLNCHPIVVGDLVLLCDETRIRAFDLRSGRPAWGTSDGVVFADAAPPQVATARRRVKMGTPHYTMTAHNGLLLARMGEPTTAWAIDAGDPRRVGALVCLDLAADGRLLWKIRPDGPSWSFEGSPLADDANVYVAMRRSDVRPEAHVACFDAATGYRRWRRFICAADTPAQGLADEITGNLVTLAEGTIYYNTNLGVVAALAPRNGAVRWIRRYLRVRGGNRAEPAAHFRRELNPCVFDQGRLFVAPSDSAPITALAAGTGRLLWSHPLPDDVTALLGVSGGNLIASGQRLWWLDAKAGRLVWRWPESKRSGLEPRGRGVLVGTNIYWPCAETIRVLPSRPTAVTRAAEEPIRIDRFGVEAGNLVATDGYLLIAGPRQVAGLTDTWQPPKTRRHEITAVADLYR